MKDQMRNLLDDVSKRAIFTPPAEVFAADGHFYRARTCLFFFPVQVECRLPWPFSVVLPPRPMDKYNCVLGLILKIDYTVHALEESHTLYRYLAPLLRRGLVV